MTKAASQSIVEKRRAVYDLAAEGLDWSAIAVKLRTQKAICERLYVRSVREDGLEPLEHLPVVGWRVMKPDSAVPARTPRMPARIGPTAMEVDAFREAAKAAGIRPEVVRALVKRMQVGDPALVRDGVKRLEGKDLIDTMGDKLSLVLAHIDDFSVGQAGLKDLAIAAGILTEKTLLLKGQPTQIIDFTSRQQLQVLAPRLLAEAKRRGITIDGQAAVVPELAPVSAS